MLKNRLKSLKASIFIVALILLPAIGFSQTPVPMVSQSGLTYTENFADIANWAGWDESDIITGNYYDLYGGEYSPEEFHELYEPAEG
jgi:hypothetical protein